MLTGAKSYFACSSCGALVRPKSSAQLLVLLSFFLALGICVSVSIQLQSFTPYIALPCILLVACYMLSTLALKVSRPVSFISKFLPWAVFVLLLGITACLFW